MIISISGPARSGKDTLANDIVSRYNDISFVPSAKVIKFADTLKEYLVEAFNKVDYNVSKEALDGSIPGFNRELRYIPRDQAEVISAIVAIKVLEDLEVTEYTFDNVSMMVVGLYDDLMIVSVRDIMQRTGTDVVRHNIQEDYWIRKTMQEASKYQLAVISDCRFQDEFEAVYAEPMNQSYYILTDRDTIDSDHESESGLTNLTGMTIIDNNGSIDDLRRAAIEIADSVVTRTLPF